MEDDTMQPSHAVPRRQMEDITVEAGAYIRVHCRPKRFAAVYQYDWKVIHHVDHC